MMVVRCAYLCMQTSGNHCLYVEGASAVNPSSVAKVLSPFTTLVLQILLFKINKYRQRLLLRDSNNLFCFMSSNIHLLSFR